MTKTPPASQYRRVLTNQFRYDLTATAVSEEAAKGDGLESRLTLDAVLAHLDALPEEQRAVLLLVALEGFSYQEAAEMLNVPVGTVTSRLGRARKALAARLDGNAGSGSLSNRTTGAR